MTDSTAKTFAPAPRFHKGPNGRVQLRYGDIGYLADATGWSSAVLSRALRNPAAARKALRVAVYQCVGVELDLIDGPRTRAA